MNPGLLLQFGQAAKTTAPVIALLTVEQHADGEAVKGARLLSKTGHTAVVTALAVAPSVDGREPLVLSADAHGRLKLWAPRLALPSPALCPVRSHLLHGGAINCLALHPANELLATAGDDGDLRVWRLPELARCAAGRHGAAQLGCLAAHGAAVTACCFTSCGGFLASCSLDGTVRLWHAVGAGEPLATLRLLAGSVAFASGDDAALLVAAAAAGQGPQLMDLRQVPACSRYCAQLAASQRHTTNSSSSGRGGGGGGGARRAAPIAAAAAAGMHPAAAMWLPGSPRQTHRVGAGVPLPVAGATTTAPACTPCPRDRPQGTAAAAAASPASAGTVSAQRQSSPCRQAGSVVAFTRKRRRPQQQQEGEQAPATAGRGGGTDAASPCSWLPGGDSALRPPARPTAATGGGGSLFGGWAAPLSPTSPLPAAWEVDDRGSVPEAAVLARYEAPPARSSGGGGEWDAQQRGYVYRQGGHSLPVRWLLPLPAGLHMLTVACEGEAKLWATCGSSGTDGAASTSSGAHVHCTLLPAAGDRQDGPLACRPAVSACGRYVVGGGPSGSLACWDLWQLQSRAHLPLSHRDSNAAVVAQGAHAAAVTAVAFGAADTMLVSGDASGRLVLRWL